MATLLLSYTNANLLSAFCNQKYQTASKHVALQNLTDLMSSIASGTVRIGAGGGSLTSTVVGNATAATGTMVATGSASNGVTVKVGAITFTGETGTPSGNTQFKVGVSATADGLAFANAVNAHPTTSQYVSAANASGTVTLTAIGLAVGVLGNAIALTTSDGTNMGVTAFTGGVNDTGAVTYNL